MSIEAEWIEWNGGDQPVADGVMVDVKFANGDESEAPCHAERWVWSNYGGNYVVVAYRLHEPFKDAPDEAMHLIQHRDGSEVFVKWNGIEFVDIGGMPGYNISDTEWQVIATRNRDADCDCDDPAQCWEHCGMLGNDERYAARATEQVTAHNTVQAALGHMQDRSTTYDKPTGERSMSATVEAFNAISGHKLTEEQGWLFMVLLKAVRSQQGDFKLDNYEDGCSYFGLMAEAASNERPKPNKKE